MWSVWVIPTYSVYRLYDTLAIIIHTAQKSHSPVPDSKCSTILLGDLEEKGMKFLNEIAMKYYSMGFEAGMHAATSAHKKAAVSTN